MAPVGQITLEATHRCHRRCAFCYVTKLATPDSVSSGELSARDLSRLTLGVVRETGCNQVQLSGGEPLLRRDLLELIDRLIEGGASVSIITDGAQLHPQLADGLVHRGVRKVQPTLLSAAASVHDALRGEGAFQAATRAIAVGASAGLHVSVCMVLTRLNCSEAGRVAELAFALGASGLALSRFCPIGPAAAGTAGLMPSADEVRAAAESAAEVCGRVKLPLAAAVTIPRCVFSDRDNPPLRVGVCSLLGPQSTITIGPDGSVRSCSMSTRTAGNLLEDSWDRIATRLRQGEYREARESIAEACVQCETLSRCLGGCRLSAMAAGEGGPGLDPLACPGAAK